MLLAERSWLNQMDSRAIIHSVGVLPVHLDRYLNAQRHRTRWLRRAVLVPSPDTNHTMNSEPHGSVHNGLMGSSQTLHTLDDTAAAA